MTTGRGGGPPTGRLPQDDPPGTSRLFVAVPVAAEVREALARLMEDVAGGPIDTRAYGQPRWVRVDGLHVTLRFLGATPDELQPDLARAIERTAVDRSPFPIALSGAGAFPNPARPRVLWIGIVTGAGELGALASRLGGELTALGWPPEDRPFAPHLTLARTDGVPGAAERAARLAELAGGIRLEWLADRLVLYRSVLGRGPARYEEVAAAALGQA